MASSESVFETIIIVDWSAATNPTTGSDSIWFSSGGPTGTARNAPTRLGAVEKLLDQVRKVSGRVVVGFDFPFGYPRGTASEFGQDVRSFRLRIASSDRVALRRDNSNERFLLANEMNALIAGETGPFWGRPPSTKYNELYELPSSKPEDQRRFREFRLTEEHLQTTFGERPKSVWQLFSGVNVGSQTLTGLPALMMISDALGTECEIWPTDNGFEIPGSRVVLAEAWPRLVAWETLPASPDVPKDARQVRALAQAWRLLDDGGRLEGCFRPTTLEAIDPTVVQEEGWILGGELGRLCPHCGAFSGASSLPTS